MEGSSARPYLAIFAIVALAVAGFILKQELSGTNQTEDEVAAKAPQRMLVETKVGRVPEPIPDWFKRVGYDRLGFQSDQQMKDTQALLAVRRGEEYTPDQLKLIHTLVAMDGTPKTLGISVLPGLHPTEVRKQFVPDVKSLYAEGVAGANFRTILSSWCQSGDEDLVKSLTKDPNKKLAAEAQTIVTNFEFPGKDV